MRRLLAALVLLVAACSDSSPETASSDSTPASGAATTTTGTPTTPTTPAPTVPATPAPTQPPASTAPPSTAPPTTAAPTIATPPVEPLQWSQVGIGPVDEAFLDVPLDYADPSGGQISLYVVRHRALDQEARIGSLLVNPGGPGDGGSVLAQFADRLFSQALLDRFDIIGWDPRGTGESEPFIDCVDNYDPHFGIETGPDTPEQEAQLVEAARVFADGCVERSGNLLEHISTVDAARDMDAIRAALGEAEISYFGFSYGTRLGATWATLFPQTVRAAVLDGAVNPTTGRVQGLIAQTAGFDRTLSLFLAFCAENPICPFHNGGDAGGAFTALIAALEQNPISTAGGRPPLVDGVFELGVAQALYSESQWPALAQALAAAQNGDGSRMLALYDRYYRRFPDGSYPNDLEAYYVITCADDPADGGVEAAVATRPEFAAVSRIPFTQAYELVVCASMPLPPAAPFEVTGAGAGPIMVIGNTGDPATPYEGSRVMAESLEEGFFASVEAATHTTLGLNNVCIDAAIDAYLVDLVVPAGELTC